MPQRRAITILIIYCSKPQQNDAVTPTQLSHRSHTSMRALALGHDISDFNAHINTICNDIHKFHGMKIVTHAPAQRPTRRSTRRRSTRNATVDDQTDVITFCALTRRRIVSALWQVFLQKQLEIREGKDKVLATWIRDVIALS